MGLKDFMRNRADEYKQAKADFELGCEILGRPSDPRSVSQRGDRMAAGRKERLAREERARSVGHAALSAVRSVPAPHWWKVTMSTYGYDGIQSNYFEGVIGEQDGRKKIHIATDVATSELLFARDIDGNVLYDRHSGEPQPNWWP